MTNLAMYLWLMLNLYAEIPDISKQQKSASMHTYCAADNGMTKINILSDKVHLEQRSVTEPHCIGEEVSDI